MKAEIVYTKHKSDEDTNPPRMVYEVVVTSEYYRIEKYGKGLYNNHVDVREDVVGYYDTLEEANQHLKRLRQYEID